jgi:EAL domain-containing protein (putative c-di-GMP-specific phosphodiesterase class I)
MCVFYDFAYTQQMQKEHDLTALFGDSLKNEDFQVYLQPKVRLNDGTLAGAEALVRWQHPQRGTIFPSDFIPLFEQNGEICRLDLYVFEKVCELMERWLQQGRTLIPISVNLSRRHFVYPDFLLQFEEIAERHSVPRGLIEFELTESIFLKQQEIERIKQQIEKMHQLGFRCSLDDFGFGFSSLGLLKDFAVDTVKMDRSFFLGEDSKRMQEVVSCIVELTERLGVVTVAEGIETGEMLPFLRRIRCDMVQGYVFSRPLPIPQFEAWAEQAQKSGNLCVGLIAESSEPVAGG